MCSYWSFWYIKGQILFNFRCKTTRRFDQKQILNYEFIKDPDPYPFPLKQISFSIILRLDSNHNWKVMLIITLFRLKFQNFLQCSQPPFSFCLMAVWWFCCFIIKLISLVSSELENEMNNKLFDVAVFYVQFNHSAESRKKEQKGGENPIIFVIA